MKKALLKRYIKIKNLSNIVLPLCLWTGTIHPANNKSSAAKNTHKAGKSSKKKEDNMALPPERVLPIAEAKKLFFLQRKKRKEQTLEKTPKPVKKKPKSKLKQIEKKLKQKIPPVSHSSGFMSALEYYVKQQDKRAAE